MNSPAPSSVSAFVALGSNLGASRETLRQAFQRLASLSMEAPLPSSLWETTPVDCPPGSPLFLNAVVRLVVCETPESFLDRLQSLEREMGRQPKKILNEPRPLDLDIIAFGQEQRHSPRLILPHPRATTRRFVLQPLCEIAPTLVLPGQTRSIRQLLESLRTDEAIHCLGSDWHQ